jgi:hypothetical protein
MECVRKILRYVSASSKEGYNVEWRGVFQEPGDEPNEVNSFEGATDSGRETSKVERKVFALEVEI